MLAINIYILRQIQSPSKNQLPNIAILCIQRRYFVSSDRQTPTTSVCIFLPAIQIYPQYGVKHVRERTWVENKVFV